MNRWLSFSEITKLNSEKIKYRTLCRCGHSLIISNKNNRAECSHCHNLVFKDKKSEFDYRVKENQIRERRRIKSEQYYN